jgi:hypothetical protein
LKNPPLVSLTHVGREENMRQKKTFCLVLVALIVAVSIVTAADINNEIIIAALERTDGKVNMVDEKTIYWPPNYRAGMDLKWIKDDFKKQGIDVDALVEKLYDVSTQESKITINSAPDKGYIVDINHKYKDYLKEQDGFPRLYKDYPKAGCFVLVSSPVYDSHSKIALIQKHVFCWPGGTGVIEAYKNEQGKFHKIGCVGVLSFD